jgi:hypothetical protein
MPDNYTTPMTPEDRHFWMSCYTAALSGVAAQQAGKQPAEAIEELSRQVADVALKEERRRRREPAYQESVGGLNPR